ncbi:MAG: DUF2628 domain-containing protein [Pseudomonadota bacterium]
MAIWTVWENEKYGERQAERAIFVRDGFSVLAFLFGPLWLLVHGMIITLSGYLLVMFGASIAATTYLSGDAAVWIVLVLMVWFGLEARNLRRWSLASRGWEMTGVVEGRRFVNAERRYYTERLAEDVLAETPQYAVPSPWGPRPQQAVLGLFPEGPR